MDSRVVKGLDEGSSCWQFQVRTSNLDEDLKNSGFTRDYIYSLNCSDFIFKHVSDVSERIDMRKFIERHEWLGTLSQFTTHWFATYHQEHLAGVILMNLPNSFSKLLGEKTPQLERLISRGACISWSPKGLASHFLMQCIEWMVNNTDYRLFTAYSDPNAKELGTIYQACNFYYLGKNSGTTTRYINPYTGKIVSDRFFRQRSAYKRYAEELKITWQKNWTTKTGMNWLNIPNDIEKKLRDCSKLKQQASEKINFPSKHKYCYILGRDKRETRNLRKLFLDNNKIYEYPKERGK